MTVPDRPPTGGFAPLVPELTVLDLAASLRFWRDVLGFEIAYQRPEHSFVYLEREGAQVMLDLYHGTGSGIPLPPGGRGFSRSAGLPDRPPHALRGRRHVEVADAVFR
jgi:catechol 2,3-dioxygenase-like lactoylglutathione lyase family enzyme